MIFSKVNLKEALLRERSDVQSLLADALSVLKAAEENENDIRQRLAGNNRGSSHDFPTGELDPDCLFSLDDIRRVCIHYRLRFLDTSMFRAGFPYGAIQDIQAFEKTHRFKIQSFRIIAPSEAFDLENINKDPLLFAQLSENTYYLLHQWGRDLAWYRKLRSWPLQSFRNLTISIMLFCFAFSFSLPASILHVFTLQSEIYLRIWLAVHTFIGLLGLSLWAGLAFDKSFSSMNWNSKYFNY